MTIRWLVMALALLTAGCGEREPAGDLGVSVIGSPPLSLDPDRVPLRRGDAILAEATATGLVAFDSAGQITPALAESWIVADDGRSLIFRLRRIDWPNGREVTGEDVARSLNRAVADASRNRLKPLLSAVDEVVGMTGRVVEVRLKVPRPHLLQLLAQPELGVRKSGMGVGPYRATATRTGVVLLNPVVRDDDPAAATPGRRIALRGERAALAVARFVAGDSELVLGGTVADWPIAQQADVRRGRLHLDPAEGLFGLAIVRRDGVLGDVEVRQALAMAIDRPALGAMLGLDRWRPAEAVLPAQLDSAAAPALPMWVAASLEQRLTEARRRVAEWRAANGPPPVLRVALPQGPGSRLLFARLAADWGRIGVRAEMVPMQDRDADLRLIDAVAPGGSANWYLTTLSCASGLLCTGNDDTALVASRRADSLDARAALIAAADLATTERASYIALGKPIRWSLVAAGLKGWRDNAASAHPLAELTVERP